MDQSNAEKSPEKAFCSIFLRISQFLATIRWSDKVYVRIESRDVHSTNIRVVPSHVLVKEVVRHVLETYQSFYED